MGDGDHMIKESGEWPGIVPGFWVSDLERSTNLYVNTFGFALGHAESGRLAVLTHGEGRLVLSQFDPDDPLVVAELTTPFGRGVTLTVRVPDPKAIYERLRDDKYPVSVPMEIAEYGDDGQRHQRASFVVADPDGYLLRFSD